VLRHALAALVVLAGPAVAQEQKPRAVVELFTSQGCSSCPPADVLASELARDPGLIVLSLPVDYWDYLGWKDTLATRAFTARQKAYGEARGDRQVYTPQAVVDGAVHAIGSDRPAIQAAALSGKPQPALTVPVRIEDNGASIRIHVGAGTVSGPATVVVLPVRKRCDVSITRGENKGRAVSYTNVVRDVIGIGVWHGAQSTYELPSTLVTTRGGDAYVVLVQAGTPEHPGVILGAAKGPGL
jgi:hypothetical protein